MDDNLQDFKESMNAWGWSVQEIILINLWTQ